MKSRNDAKPTNEMKPQNSTRRDSTGFIVEIEEVSAPLCPSR